MAESIRVKILGELCAEERRIQDLIGSTVRATTSNLVDGLALKNEVPQSHRDENGNDSSSSGEESSPTYADKAAGKLPSKPRKRLAAVIAEAALKRQLSDKSDKTNETEEKRETQSI